jgi:hypothetical protein
MQLKGQAALEYVTTYGWMLVAVALVGGSIYSQIDRPCNFDTRNLDTNNVVVDKVAVSGESDLMFSFRSMVIDEVKIQQVRLEGNETLYSNRTVRLSDSSEPVELGNVEPTESCQDYEFTVVYDRGPVPNIKETATFKLPVILDRILIPYLFESGGEIGELNSTSSLMATDSDICLGGKCPDTDKEEKVEGNYVNRSGDELTGTLKTNAIKWECMGGNCDAETGNLDGFLSSKNNTVDGTLNLTELKPDQNLCMGKTC